MSDLERELRRRRAWIDQASRLLTDCCDLRVMLELGVMTEDEARVVVLRLRGAIEAHKRARLTGTDAGGNMDEPY